MPKHFRILSAVVSAGLAGSLLVWPAVTVDGRGLVLLALAVVLVLTADRVPNVRKVEESKWNKNHLAARRRR